MTALPVPLVSVRGTPAECGAGYGAAAAERIRANLELYRRRFRDQAGLGPAEVRAAGERFREVTAELQPRVAAMLDGVAAGAGEPAEDIYALNARTELLYAAPPDRFRAPTDRFRAPTEERPGSRERSDRAESRSARRHQGAEAARAERAPASSEGCTAIGVLGGHTADGHLLLAQNWDWHPDQRDAMVLLDTIDERGHRVLTLAEAGMLAKTGLNSARLGVCVNLLGCDRDGLPGGPTAAVGPTGAAGRPGLPYHVLLRVVLEADNLGAALRAVCRSPRNASINLLIGQAGPDADPAGGELIDLELVPGDVGWLHPVDGVLTHANHLETALPVRDVAKDLGGSTLYRAARARRLLAGPAAAGKVTPDDLIGVLRDHASYPMSICRHVDERDEPLDRSESVFSLVLDLDAGRLAIAGGPPCVRPYTWIDLDRPRA